MGKKRFLLAWIKKLAGMRKITDSSGTVLFSILKINLFIASREEYAAGFTSVQERFACYTYELELLT
jgi:hypothetical protein